MKAFLFCAGRGIRFRPVTETIPKPLLPYLNVPLARAHLRLLGREGFSEVGVNLHHLGEKVERHLREEPAELPRLAFFHEPELLGTAGALRNTAAWLAGEDVLVFNSDVAIEPDLPTLAERHRTSGRAATLLVVPNREPDRYTPLQTDRDRITSFGGAGSRPLLYTGVSVLSPRLLERIRPGVASLVEDLWAPLLADGREEIGWVLHEGAFSDLGTPRDFLRATVEALARSGPFPSDGGTFDRARQVLPRHPVEGFEARASVIGDAQIERGALIAESVVWDGVEVGAGARLEGCLAAGGRVPSGMRFEDALLWAPGRGEPAAAYPIR